MNQLKLPIEIQVPPPTATCPLIDFESNHMNPAIFTSI
ncbi:hypothetical protein KIS1582_3876 [Cytobacillus firmus]|uniref:Uncharacterized protein n=1 Tax=Cytobacillus firmus TaxID=1399 RepID=A0A800MTX3_CYTFI|nr:hypothetical protein KIS1582_3876 [Cytobacillus firmus]